MFHFLLLVQLQIAEHSTFDKYYSLSVGHGQRNVLKKNFWNSKLDLKVNA